VDETGVGAGEVADGGGDLFRGGRTAGGGQDASWSSWLPIGSVPSVRVGPGLTALTRTPLGPNSAAQALVSRVSGGKGYVTDVVCGMQVEKANAPATAAHDGHTFYFCSDRCRDRFTASPAAFASGHAAQPVSAQPQHDAAAGPADPVCGMAVDPAQAAASATYAGRTYFFCAHGCRDQFAADPLACLPQAPDPVCGMTVDVTAPAATARHDGQRYVFCSPGCRDAFTADPAGYTGQDSVAVGDPARRD
jgi:YHS domain-containing protein